MRPDLEAVAQGTPGALQSSYFVPKTIDDYDVISETDEIQFSKLKTDSEKYDMVKGMITGAETKTENPPFKVSDPYVNADGEYVNDGEYRGLKTILQDLINKGKVWLNPKDGNIYEMQFALQNRMISFHCAYCSKILYNPKDKAMHEVSTHIARRI
jgi:hypothetical protein